MVVEAQSVCILLLFCWFVVAALCSSIHLKKTHTHTQTPQMFKPKLSAQKIPATTLVSVYEPGMPEPQLPC